MLKWLVLAGLVACAHSISLGLLEPPNRMRIGTSVRIKGLENKPEYNGKQGEVVRWNTAKSRYVVRLQGEDSELVTALPENIQEVNLGNQLSAMPHQSAIKAVKKGAPRPFAVNEHVRIMGLGTDSDFNGKEGSILGSENGRWMVDVDGEVVGVRRANLQLITPAAPPAETVEEAPPAESPEQTADVDPATQIKNFFDNLGKDDTQKTEETQEHTQQPEGEHKEETIEDNSDVKAKIDAAGTKMHSFIKGMFEHDAETPAAESKDTPKDTPKAAEPTHVKTAGDAATADKAKQEDSLDMNAKLGEAGTKVQSFFKGVFSSDDATKATDDAKEKQETKGQETNSAVPSSDAHAAADAKETATPGHKITSDQFFDKAFYYLSDNLAKAQDKMGLHVQAGVAKVKPENVLTPVTVPSEEQKAGSVTDKAVDVAASVFGKVVDTIGVTTLNVGKKMGMAM
jgi:hypothetical protein